ncbi:hypothetical protein PCASD_17135 [Puccinia coronata f. sp. avenae]|uniref:Uncharacterized protein n=1 Tax=Puccinia coronata f. sp. avenae TaxID=200324 RepID=A0A2N5SXD9_9BASI|nr:hypothetical protein PCASD_17135 [Puccinia coronata f. sp. avenae]
MVPLLSKRYGQPGLPSWTQPVRITHTPRPLQQEQLLDIELDYSSLQALPDTPPPPPKATLPAMNLPPCLPMDSMQSLCPSSLGLDAEFTPLQSSYTRPDFDPYNQYHHYDHAQEHYGHPPLHNDEYNATSCTNTPPSVMPQFSFTPALQTTHLPNPTGFPGITSHPDLQQNNNSLTTSGTNIPNSLTNSMPNPTLSSQLKNNIPPSQPAPKRCARSRRQPALVTPSTAQPTLSAETNDVLPPPIPLQSNSEFNAPVPSKHAPRAKLSAHLVEAARGKKLDELIKLVGNDSKYVRLTAENQLQLNNAYMEYQRQLYLIAYENRVDIEPCLKYAGEAANSRVSTNYNNYCRYNPEARKIYKDKSIDHNERNRQCEQLWKKLDVAMQEKWKDSEFLQSFQSCSAGIGETDNLPDQPDQPNPKNRARTSFETDTWANKVVADLRNLSRRSGIEGFLVIGSRGKGKFHAFNGGSHLGKRFLDMFSNDKDPCQLFIDFIKGHTVVKTLTGIKPPPVAAKKKGPKPREIITSHDKGSIANNVAFIRDKLNKAIDEAAPGKFGQGWPGTKTREKLQAAGVSLAVRQNDLRVTALDFCLRPGDMRDKHSQKVVAALEENWVELRVESTKSPNFVGSNIPNTQKSSIKRISVGRYMESTHNNDRSDLDANDSQSSSEVDPEEEGETEN